MRPFSPTWAMARRVIRYRFQKSPLPVAVTHEFRPCWGLPANLLHRAGGGEQHDATRGVVFCGKSLPDGRATSRGSDRSCARKQAGNTLPYGRGSDWYRYTLPPFITNTTLRTAVMSSSGLPSVATKSAWNPGARVPISLPNPSDSAEMDVALTTASIGLSCASRTR